MDFGLNDVLQSNMLKVLQIIFSALIFFIIFNKLLPSAAYSRDGEHKINQIAVNWDDGANEWRYWHVARDHVPIVGKCLGDFIL